MPAIDLFCNYFALHILHFMVVAIELRLQSQFYTRNVNLYCSALRVNVLMYKIQYN